MTGYKILSTSVAGYEILSPVKYLGGIVCEIMHIAFAD